MAFQPLGGICWGLSAVRPPSPVAAGLVVCSGGGWPPAAAPGPCEAADPPLRVAWPSLALPPPAVLRPTSTAVASIPTRSVDLIILRVSPGRFRPVFAALPMGSSSLPMGSPSAPCLHSQETRGLDTTAGWKFHNLSAPRLSTLVELQHSRLPVHRPCCSAFTADRRLCAGHNT